MSTSSSHLSGPARSAPDKGRRPDEAVQQALSGFLAVPQRLMQINIEAANHAVAFMTRRMKANAALWSSMGHFSDVSGAAEAQRTFLETVTKDYVAEMTELTDLARKNLASVSDAAAGAPLPGFAAGRSS